MRKIEVPMLSRDIGLGGLVKKVSKFVGVRPCGGCKKRADYLDSKVVFTSTKEKHASR